MAVTVRFYNGSSEIHVMSTTLTVAAHLVGAGSSITRPVATDTASGASFSWKHRTIAIDGASVNELREAYRASRTLDTLHVQSTLPTIVSDQLADESAVRTAVKVEAPKATGQLELGTYTIVDNDAKHHTFRIVDREFRDGTTHRIAQYLSGSDNESSYTGFAFVQGRFVNVWGRFRNGPMDRLARQIEAMVATDTAEEAGMRYALESSCCRRCNRTLTVPASIHRGYGPECIKKV